MTNPRTGCGSIDLACVGVPHLPTSGRPRPRIACHHCLNLDQWESLMPSPMARDLWTNFKARGHRRFEQHACYVETLTWSVSDGCPGVRVGPTRFRQDLVASLDPRDQVQLLERARPKSANQPTMTLVDDEFHLGPTAIYSPRQVNRSPVFCEPLVALSSIWSASMNNTIPQLSSVLRRSYAKRLRHTTRDEPRCGCCSRDALDRNVCGATAAGTVWSLKPWLGPTTRSPQLHSLTKYRSRCETSEICKHRVCRV